MQFDAKEFLNALPAKVNPAAIEGLSTLFHFEVSDSGSYTVQLQDGKIDVQEGLHGSPSCTVKTSQESMGKLISGDLNPMMAMMTGKLKISNPGELLKYAKIFGLM
jgi:putative sterol carrier protein